MSEMEVACTGRNFTGVTITDMLYSSKQKMILEVILPHFVNSILAKLLVRNFSRAIYSHQATTFERMAEIHTSIIKNNPGLQSETHLLVVPELGFA